MQPRCNPEVLSSWFVCVCVCVSRLIRLGHAIGSVNMPFWVRCKTMTISKTMTCVSCPGSAPAEPLEFLPWLRRPGRLDGRGVATRHVHLFGDPRRCVRRGNSCFGFLSGAIWAFPSHLGTDVPRSTGPFILPD